MTIFSVFNNFFVSEFFDLLEEASLLRKEGNLDFLSPLVESPDEAEEAVDVVGDGNHFVHEIIQATLSELEPQDRELLIHRYSHLDAPEHIAETRPARRRRRQPSCMSTTSARSAMSRVASSGPRESQE